MRKVIVGTIITSLLLFALPSGVSAQYTSKAFKNCTELRKKYQYGVAKDAKSAGSSGALVNAAIYKQNIKSDRDKDGIACEK